MKKENNLNALFEMVQQLSKREQRAFAEQIMEMMAMPAAERIACSELVEDIRPGRPDCPHCGAKASHSNIIKRGKHKEAQRFFCKSCGKYFVTTTSTAFARSRKDADTWRRFIEMTITGASLYACAEDCHIAYQTAFNWRHKVLNVFKSVRRDTRMDGRVEIDEMFIPLSYKGNHIKGQIGTKRVRESGMPNNMIRKAFRRGTDNKPKSPKERACVFCMVANGDRFYGSVPGVGQMTAEMLDATLARHVQKDSSKVLADMYKVTNTYLLENGYSFRTLASNTSDNIHDHKPEIVDGEHLQHVNVMHQQVRKFLAKYCGVSSKYLDNYISFFVWLKNTQAIKQRKRVNKLTLSQASTAGCYIQSSVFTSYPMIPTLQTVA